MSFTVQPSPNVSCNKPWHFRSITAMTLAEAYPNFNPLKSAFLILTSSLAVSVGSVCEGLSGSVWVVVLKVCRVNVEVGSLKVCQVCRVCRVCRVVVLKVCRVNVEVGSLKVCRVCRVWVWSVKCVRSRPGPVNLVGQVRSRSVGSGHVSSCLVIVPL